MADCFEFIYDMYIKYLFSLQPDCTYLSTDCSYEYTYVNGLANEVYLRLFSCPDSNISSLQAA